MKIAFYMEDGLEQIVLTPQNDTEKAMLGKLHDRSRSLSVYRGEFYACQGGWTRHSYGADQSTILVLRPKETVAEEPPNTTSDEFAIGSRMDNA